MCWCSWTPSCGTEHLSGDFWVIRNGEREQLTPCSSELRRFGLSIRSARSQPARAAVKTRERDSPRVPTTNHSETNHAAVSHVHDDSHLLEIDGFARIVRSSNYLNESLCTDTSGREINSSKGYH